MSEQPKYIYFNATQSAQESISKDVVTFSFMMLCIYSSQDSTFWTFASGAMFIFFMSAKIKLMYDRRSRPFKTKAELVKYVNSLPDDGSIND